MLDSDLRHRWIEWIVRTFEHRRCVFGSLVYPKKPHPRDIEKSARIYTEQVLRRSCKSHQEPLGRIFVMEQTPGEEIQRTKVLPIPLTGMPDFPHMHFVMEVPTGLNSDDFIRLCEDRWYRMNTRDMTLISQLAKVEEIRDLAAVARYVTKEFVKTQGENIILTHATHLKESAVAS